MKRRLKTTRNDNRHQSGGFVALNIVMLLAVMTALACGGGGSGPTAPPPFEDTQAAGTTGAPGAEVPIPADEGSHIRLEKATNGEDADLPPGPTIPVGDPVTWTYVITNLQEATLLNLSLTDDIEGAVTCPTTTLLEGESMTCTLTGVATTIGQYENLATVTGDVGDTGQTETVTDPSHYFGEGERPVHIQLEKATNGEDADTPTGPFITVGGQVTWTYVITNLLETTLSNIELTDDMEGLIATCPADTLAGFESMTCEATGIAQEGQYSNLATVTATAEDGETETDTDPSHYFGEAPPAGEEGCTPGFWKNNADKKGAVAWPPGYTPSTTLDVVGFVNAIGVDPSAITMQEALNFGGGPDLEDWERRLFRHSTAAVLNAASVDVFYPWTVAQIVDEVNIALASDDQGQINALKDDIDAMNNLGCPINQRGER